MPLCHTKTAGILLLHTSYPVARGQACSLSGQSMDCRWSSSASFLAFFPLRFPVALGGGGGQVLGVHKPSHTELMLQASPVLVPQLLGSFLSQRDPADLL
jgi:hypothetical protein